jgi:hypothetical protein
VSRTAVATPSAAAALARAAATITDISGRSAARGSSGAGVILIYQLRDLLCLLDPVSPRGSGKMGDVIVQQDARHVHLGVQKAALFFAGEPEQVCSPIGLSGNETGQHCRTGPAVPLAQVDRGRCWRRRRRGNEAAPPARPLRLVGPVVALCEVAVNLLQVGDVSAAGP